MTRNLPKTPFPSLAASKQFAEKHRLMPLNEVAQEWQRLSGQRISDARVYQILRVAEAKLAAGLREFAADLQ